jgi:hypothetical protein
MATDRREGRGPGRDTRSMGVKVFEGNIRLITKALEEQYFLSDGSRGGRTGRNRRREDRRGTLPKAMR